MTWGIAARAVKVGGHVSARGLEVAEHRHASPDGLEVVESQGDARPQWAMASRWSTALVEPPTAITTAIAFSKASRVRIWRGRRPALIAATSTLADSAALSAFSSSSAAMVDEQGRLMPIASMTDDMVLAVYIPPQEPAPGQAFRSTSSSSAASIFPAACSPTASNTLTMVRSRPAWCPGLMVPP